MLLTRRTALAILATAPSVRTKPLGGVRIGVTDWNLRMAGQLSAVELASRLGFEGVEVSLGRKVEGDKLPLDDAETIAKYKDAFRTHRIKPAGTCLDVLHVNYLKNDPLGQKWLADGIRLTKSLGAKVMLLPFFGKGALETHKEKEYVGDALKELAPQAEKAGVILALEDTISAEDNVRIMERSKSKAVLVYYDVGNSTAAGFDITKEIDWLGRKRIAQVHLKDNPGYLGEGKIDLVAVMRALSRIGYEGFANLETSAPSKSVEADMKRNLAYVKKVMEEVRG